VKKPWKRIVLGCVVIVIAFCATVLADDSGSRRSESVPEQKVAGKVPDAGLAARPEATRLTDEQKAVVASILSQYDASSLTAENAKAINNAFRKAGIRNGPDLREAVKAAGFDGKTISTLDPPPAPLHAVSRTNGQTETKPE
jgi:hypothetical protein